IVRFLPMPGGVYAQSLGAYAAAPHGPGRRRARALGRFLPVRVEHVRSGLNPASSIILAQHWGAGPSGWVFPWGTRVARGVASSAPFRLGTLADGSCVLCVVAAPEGID